MKTIISRRQMLRTCANGFPMLALADLLARDVRAATVTNPLAIKPPHFAPRAKRVIFLFMPGGPSHVDLFDPKPRLAAEAGKPLPFDKPSLMRTQTKGLLPSPWKFRPHGQCGTPVSELLPHIASCVDDLCVVRSMVADNINHNGALLQMNTGEQAFSRPSMGSWLLYGLGTENQNLPGFVVISPNQPGQGAPLWSSSFLPAAYQGTYVSDLANPIDNIRLDAAAVQRRQLDTLKRLNLLHRDDREEDTRLSARIEAFELAFRMQAAAPEAFDLSGESPATRQLYGLDDPVNETFATQCLMARRLVERGVRFVQCFHTQRQDVKLCQLWDQHGNLRADLKKNCDAIDRPGAGLIKDLKGRGLLDETLVIWGGEFGRTPTAENDDGREHHPFGFTMFLAGGGIKGGMVYGNTDDYGWHSVENRVHVHDLHATILHLMGINHERLTYRYSGRDFRLTDVHGHIVRDILV